MRAICLGLVFGLSLGLGSLLFAEDAKSTPKVSDSCPKKSDSPKAAPAREEGFSPIFDGRSLDGWVGVAGSTDSYEAKDGMLICKADGREHIFTEKEFSDFVLRFEFKLEPGGNNGVGIRADISREPHLFGMEIQVLDDSAPKHADLKPYQYHGSIYGALPAKRGALKPVGQWNEQEIVCRGRRVKVTLNGTVIVDVDLDEIPLPTPDHKEHPGLKYTKGRIGLHAHHERVYFRNMRVKEF